MAIRRGDVAVVVGAGIGGLTAARALSDHFARVDVIESDILPQEAVPRAGTPQSRHLHALSAGGMSALNSLFPGFEQDLIAAGAVPIGMTHEYLIYRPGYHPFPRLDLGLTTYSMSRPLIDMLIRKRIGQYPNIRILQRWKALEFVANPGTGTIDNIHCQTPDETRTFVPFDCAVDASGHGTLLMNLLKSAGQPPPEEAIVEVDLVYATTIFDIPENGSRNWKAVAIQPHPEANRQAGFLFPIENNQWMVVLTGRYDDKPSDNPAEVLAHLRNLPVPEIYEAVKNARQRGTTARYGFKASRWRRFDKASSLPDNIVPFGDTICRFNPMYGQGMGVAARQATLLRAVLGGSGNPHDVGREFSSRTQELIEGPWLTGFVPDFADPRTPGDRPPELASALKFSAALLRRASEDAHVCRIMFEVQQLIKPRSALKELQIDS